MKRKKKFYDNKELLENNDPDIISFKNNILKHRHDLWIPKLPLSYTSVDFNNWFTFNKTYNPDSTFTGQDIQESPFQENYVKTIKAKIIFDKKQKYIIDSWLDSSTLMYNCITEYLSVKNKFVKAHENIINDQVKISVDCFIYLNQCDHLIDIFKCFHQNNHKIRNIKKNILEFKNKFDIIFKEIEQIKKNFMKDDKNLNLLIKSFQKNYEYDQTCSNFNCSYKDVKKLNIKYFLPCQFFDLIPNYPKTNTFKIINEIIQTGDDLSKIYYQTLNVFSKLFFLITEIDKFCHSNNIQIIKIQDVNYFKYAHKIIENKKIRLVVKANFFEIRSLFKDKRDEIIKKSIKPNTFGLASESKIHVHMMDGTINIVCSNFNSKMTNYFKRNIDYFRIRKIKENKNNKILKLEQYLFTHGTICNTILGSVGLKCDGNLCKEFEIDKEKKYSKYGKLKCVCNKHRIIRDLTFLQNNESDLLLHHNKKKQEYILLIYKKESPKKIENRKKLVSIDPGIKTFLTCLSENEVLKICPKQVSNIKNKLYKKILELGNLKKIKNESRRKYKMSEKIKKIKNLSKEMHCKVINHLTETYDTIIMGNMSTKGVISSKSYISGEDKDYLSYLSLSKFRERLENKSGVRKVNYILSDEYLTSKTCSLCSKINWKLRNEDIFKCVNKECNLEIDRDVNGCRNIYIKTR